MPIILKDSLQKSVNELVANGENTIVPQETMDTIHATIAANLTVYIAFLNENEKKAGDQPEFVLTD